MSRASTLILAFVLGCAGVPSQHIRVSSLGYTAAVPPGWAAIGRDELAGHEVELESAFESQVPRSLDRATGGQAMTRIKQSIREGKIDFLVPSPRAEGSYENINVQVFRGWVPPIGTDIRSLCDPLAADMSQAFGRPIIVHTCSLQQVANEPAIVVESDGVYEGSLLLQYHLNHSPGKILTITATLRAASADSFRPLVRDFVESVSFPKQ